MQPSEHAHHRFMRVHCAASMAVTNAAAKSARYTQARITMNRNMPTGTARPPTWLRFPPSGRNVLTVSATCECRTGLEDCS